MKTILVFAAIGAIGAFVVVKMTSSQSGQAPNKSKSLAIPLLLAIPLVVGVKYGIKEGISAAAGEAGVMFYGLSGAFG